MLFTLTSTLHTEKAQVIMPVDESFVAAHQVVVVMTGGTEMQFVQLVQEEKITLSEPVYIIVTQQSNSLAAGLEILSWINQQNGHGEIRRCRLAQ